jgi:glycerophosphoryl diester phosphodiesterase
VGVLDPRVPALVDGVSRILTRLGAAERTLISSFDPRAVALWKWRRPDVGCALLFEAETMLSAAKALALPWLHPSAVHPEWSLCTEDLVGRWHQAGYAVNTWTVDPPERLRALRDMGVDGLITNDPAAARAALA